MLFWMASPMRCRRSDERPTDSGETTELAVLEGVDVEALAGFKRIDKGPTTNSETSNAPSSVNSLRSLLIRSLPFGLEISNRFTDASIPKTQECIPTV